MDCDNYVCSTRAVYLDLASNLSGHECIEVLKRFIARKGAPNTVLSDNGKCFISEDVQNFAASKNIVWKFNIESAPWQGGFFERLVKSVKRPLKKILSNSRLKYNELLTILTDIEFILNNRPLTYIYEELNKEPLTPNHLMYGRKLNMKADDSNLLPATNTSIAEISVKRKENINRLLTHFWNRWRDEYVTELREYHKMRKNRFNKDIVANKDDVVIIADDRMPRAQWRIGRITDVIKGKDQRVRAAIIQCQTDQGRRSNIRRPVNKLIPLELSEPAESEPVIKFVDEKDIEMTVN